MISTRVGVVILPDLPWQQAREQWRREDEYGFDHAWTYDHLGWRDLVAGPWFDAVPTLTAAALATSRIRLGTLVASPNFRHPVHFTREAPDGAFPPVGNRPAASRSVASRSVANPQVAYLPSGSLGEHHSGSRPG